MRRAAQSKIDAVQLVARSAANRQAKIADRLIGADSFENKCGTLIEASRLAFEARGRRVPTHRLEAIAGNFIRRPAAMSPQPAELAGGAHVEFARFGIPRARAGDALSDFDHVWSLGVDPSDPVIAIPAEIHQAPAGVEVSDHGRPHR